MEDAFRAAAGDVHDARSSLDLYTGAHPKPWTGGEYNEVVKKKAELSRRSEVMLRVVDDSPDCFTPEQVAEVRAHLH